MAYTLSKGMRMEKMWQDAGIMEQQRVWVHSDDATFISFTMSSSHILHDESMRKQIFFFAGVILWRAREDLLSFLV